jgi:hypothetical protein
MIYSSVNKTDTYIELTEGDNKLIMPVNSAIIVEDESDLKTIKSIGSRKNIASYKEEENE